MKLLSGFCRVVVPSLLIGFVVCCADERSEHTLLPGFSRSEFFEEQIQWQRLENGVRVHINCPAEFKHSKRTLVVYATPNGNSIEQTLGCLASPGLDWHFYIQHVAAQIRRLRETDQSRDVVVAVVQAPKLSWPAFRQEHPEFQKSIRNFVDGLASLVHADEVALTCHSGGGAFLFSYISAADAIPDHVSRFVFLDANYSYSDAERHGEKLLQWLKKDPVHTLMVIAYDDREIELNGKKVVGPDGGTFRATERMLTRFRQDESLTDETYGPFRHVTGRSGQLQFFVHPNPDNKILHTRLVGEMNGLIHGLTFGTPLAENAGTFGGPQAYLPWIQQRPSVEIACQKAVIASNVPVIRIESVARPSDAPTGSQFAQQIGKLSREQREAAVAKEIKNGNFPESLRILVPVQFEAIDTEHRSHTATLFVLRDYLAVGSDADSLRMPMTPQTAIQIADSMNASMLTTRMSDLIWCAASARLVPRPMTEKREDVETFLEHHNLIEMQLRNFPSTQLIAGIKKDVVISNRLKDKPHRVAIYGWHHQDGTPIQPLYTGHVDWYVDYSHGVRLAAHRMLIDGTETTISDVLKDPRLHTLLSNEGPLDINSIRTLVSP